MMRWIRNGRTETRGALNGPSHARSVGALARAWLIGMFGFYAFGAAAQSGEAGGTGGAAATPLVPTPREVAAGTAVAGAEPGAQARADRLKLAIERTAEGNARTRILGGVTGTALGGLAGAVGVLVAVQDSSTWGRSTGRAALSGTLLTVGLSAIAISVYHWIVVSPAEARLARWNELERRDALGPPEIARFEGELHSEAEQTGSIRQSGVVTSLAAVAGGGLLIALSASGAMEGSGARSAGYTIGGISAGIGAAQAALGFFFGSTAERAWREYTLPIGGGSATLRLERPRHSSQDLGLRLAL